MMIPKRNLGLFLVFLLLVISLPLTIWSLKNLRFETRKKASEKAVLNISTPKRSIVVLNLFIDRTNSTIKIDSIKKGVGFVPDYKNPNATDYIEVQIQNQQGLKEYFSIPLPERIVYQPPRPNSKPAPPLAPLDKFNYAFVLPAQENDLILISKDFREKTKALSVKIEVRIPNRTIKKAQITFKNQTIQIPISELSLESTLGGLPNYWIETVFDGDPSLADPAKSLDIVFVPSGFSTSNFDKYRSFSNQQADALIGFTSFPGKEPFSTNKRVIKVRQLFIEANFKPQGYVDQNLLVDILTAIGIPFDQVAIILNEDGRSYSTLGGLFCVLYPTWDTFVQPNMLLAHEIAHSFAAVLDEYVEDWNRSGELWGGGYGRNCKEDPGEPWLNNLPGGAYLGCEYYPNLYRPERNSLMVSLQDHYTFNAPSKFLIEQAFSSYTRSGYAIIANPARFKTYYDLKSRLDSLTQTIQIRDLNKAHINFHSYFFPVPDWIVPNTPEGTTPATIQFTINYPVFTTKGKYETTLFVEFPGNPSLTKGIPISVFVGDSNDNPSLAWVSPATGQVFNLGDKTPVSLSGTIEPPGWIRAVYYFYDPYQSLGENAFVFDSRTINPLQALWDTTENSPNLSRYTPGTYILWAKAYPYFGQNWEIETDKIEVDLKAPAGTNCNYTQNCKNQKSSRQCFRGAEDCQRLGFTFCCPVLPSITPPPTSLTPTPLPTNITPTPSVNPVNWQTPYVSLQADDFYLMADGEKYLANVGDVRVNSNPGDPTHTSLELTWQEHGKEMRLSLYFNSDGDKWWSPEIRTYNGRSPSDWLYYTGHFFETPVGTGTRGDMYIENDSRDPIRGALYFKNFRLQAFLNRSLCPSGIKGNLDCDSQSLINSTDLNILLDSWNIQGPVPMPPPQRFTPDLNYDSRVNETDLSILLSNWKPIPTP